ncbi:SPFH domain-containing protein [Paenibacillus sp. CAU 1782]
MFRYPGDSFVHGAQLIVGEGQIAVLVKGGKALEYFSAGTYTLSTKNIPLLKSIVNLPFGKKTPFSVEIFFINRTAKLDILWGTSDPVSLIDPKYNVRLRVRAFGQLGIRVEDFRVFLTELIGTLGDHEVVKYDSMIQYFKGLTVTKVKTVISSTVIKEKISVLEIAPLLEEISDNIEANIAGEFERFGLSVVNFNVSSINFPDEDFDIINKILGEKASFDIIGDNRYNIKRSFDVMESAAGSDGGGLTAAGIGIGLGTSAGLAVGGTLAGAAGGILHPPSPLNTNPCSSCGTANDPDSKFCGNCGDKLGKKQVECGACGNDVDIGTKFCPECGNSMLKKTCAGCGHENGPEVKFCSECGGKLGGQG